MKKNGPPKKPTHLKLIEGTYRADRAAKNEAKPEACVPDMPDHLSPDAKDEWGRISKELAGLGLLTRIDRAALCGYCEAWSDFVKATREVQVRGFIFKTAAGNVIENPFYSIKKRSAELMHKFLTEFGMTPAARTRIEAVEAATPSAGEAEGGNRWAGF